MITPLETVAIGVALLMGMAAHRTGACSVRAVVELVRERRASMFGMFARMVLWTFAVLALIVQFVDDRASFPAGYAISIAGLMGGLLFGVGAAVNGACAISTLTRLSTGDMGFLATIGGMVVGMAFTATVPVAPVRGDSLLVALSPRWAMSFAVAAWAWGVFELGRLLWTRGLRPNREPHEWSIWGAVLP